MNGEDKNRNPKVSVCIPVYNGEKFIEQTILSVLGQTFQDYELLIVDNVSTDQTAEIVERFSDERIRWIQNEKNVGMVGNWNLCLEKARGKYIHFLCADDMLEPQCLEKKVQVLDDYEDVNLVFCATEIIDENNNRLLIRRAYRKNKSVDGRKLAHRSFLIRNIFGEPSNIMIRKSIVPVVGGFNDKMCYSPDWEYWMRIAGKGNVYYINEILARFRVSVVSTTTALFKNREKIKEDERIFVESIFTNPDLNIKLWEVWVHTFMLALRGWMKKVFLDFRGRFSKKA